MFYFLGHYSSSTRRQCHCHGRRSTRSHGLVLPRGGGGDVWWFLAHTDGGLVSRHFEVLNRLIYSYLSTFCCSLGTTEGTCRTLCWFGMGRRPRCLCRCRQVHVWSGLVVSCGLLWSLVVVVFFCLLFLYCYFFLFFAVCSFDLGAVEWH
jgi:hypothetical protein